MAEPDSSPAKGVVEQHQDLVLPNKTFDALMTELDQPPEVVDELVELFDKHRG